MSSVYRITYGSGPSTSFVVAPDGTSAVGFLGIPKDMPAQVVEVARNVEVMGVDKPHAPLTSPAPSVAPFDLPKGVGRQEFDALAAQLSKLQAQIAAPKSSPDQPGAAGTTPAK